MREINAYQCADGTIHTNEKKARAHDDDLLGQEIDGLLKLFELDISRNQEYKGCLAVMKRREDLKTAAAALLHILQHGEGNDND